MADMVESLTHQDTPDEHLMRSVSGSLSYLAPDIYALDTLLRRMPKGETPIQVKHEWGTVTHFPRVDLVSENSAEGAAGAQVTVVVANPGRWRVQDIIHLPKVTSVPLLVEAVTATQIKVRALGIKTVGNPTGFGTVPALPAGTEIVWIGDNIEEKGTISKSRAIMPDYEFNFLEQHSQSVDISEIKKKIKNYGGIHDWARARKDLLREFRLSMEAKNWFGQRSHTIDNGSSEERWTQGGVTQFITKKFLFDKDVVNQPLITEGQLIDWLTEVFAGNNGSPTRFLFADTYLLGTLAKIPLLSTRLRSTVNVLGVKVSKVEFEFGTVYFKHQRIFNELAHPYYGVLLDMEHVRKCIPNDGDMDIRSLDYKGQGKLAEGEYYVETSTIKVNHGPQVHAIIQGD